MPEYLTPDQIEQKVIEEINEQHWVMTPMTETAIAAISLFRKELSKNGYVLYQP